MKSLHRVVVGGGFGVLAMAGVASSVAFACTAQAPMSGAGGVTTVVAAPGTTVTVEARGFAVDAPGNVIQYEGYSSPVFTWDTVGGPVLAVAGEPTWVPQATGGVRPVWVLDVQIPADAVPREKPYGIVGNQNKPNGTSYVAGTLPVFVSGPIPAANVPTPGPVQTAQPGPNVAPIVSPQATPTPTPQATPTAPTGAPAGARPGQPAATSAAVQAPTASPGTAAPSSVIAAPRATATQSGPVATPGSPVNPATPMAVPATEELWSGLTASTSASALLDAPAPATSGSGFPAGAALLGTGMLALAGTAVLAGKRRLAVARAVRR